MIVTVGSQKKIGKVSVKDITERGIGFIVTIAADWSFSLGLKLAIS